MQSVRRAVLVLSLLIGVAAGGFAAGWFCNAHRQNKIPLPVLGRSAVYTLTNQLGQSVSSKAFTGKVCVVAFLFPYCRGYCPLLAHTFASLAQSLKAARLADAVQLIAFNVDPEGTGWMQMKAFQQQYGWDPRDLRWQYLTGPPGEIRRVVTGSYQIDYQKVSDAEADQAIEKAKREGTSIPEPMVSNTLADQARVDYDIVHNDALVIVDPAGRIRKIFDHADRISDEQLLEVIYQLLPSR